jgi:hypothetical protein
MTITPVLTIVDEEAKEIIARQIVFNDNGEIDEFLELPEEIEKSDEFLELDSVMNKSMQVILLSKTCMKPRRLIFFQFFHSFKILKTWWFLTHVVEAKRLVMF